MRKTMSRQMRRCNVLIACILLGAVFYSTPVRAIATGDTTSLVKILTGGVEIGAAILRDEAWAGGYAAVLWNEEEDWDTTLWGDPNLAYVNVRAKSGFLGRAHAIASANKKTGEISVWTKKKRLGVATAVAGIGTEYEVSRAGSKWWNVVTKVINIILDPPPDVIPDQFIYTVDLTDPFGQTQNLLNIDGYMEFDTNLNDWTLQINDSTGNMSINDFDRSVEPDGRVIYALKNPIEYQMEVLTPNPWPVGSTFKLHTYTDLKPVPEPCTMLLLGTGLVGLVGFGRKRLLKKG